MRIKNAEKFLISCNVTYYNVIGIRKQLSPHCCKTDSWCSTPLGSAHDLVLSICEPTSLTVQGFSFA